MCKAEPPSKSAPLCLHIDKAGVVTLERYDKRVGRAISVLGNNNVGLAGAR